MTKKITSIRGTFIEKAIRFFLELLLSIRRYKYDVLIIDETPYSGSNSYAFYRYLKEKSNLKVKLIPGLTHEINKEGVKLLGLMKFFLDYIISVKSSRFVFTTHSIYVLLKRKKQKFIQFWHGIPLKAMGLLDQTEKNKRAFPKVWKKYDYIVSSSPFYNTLLNSTTGSYRGKYIITGFPRTDYFSKGKLSKIIKKGNKRTILFIPTFRKSYSNRIEGSERDKNIFGMNNFNILKFEEFLEKNNLLFIAKLHPFEEAYYKKIYEKVHLKNFMFLSQEKLSSKGVDLYEILPDSDMLITDYSSIYFDYLLLNKPIIFITNDLEEYTKSRGFLLYPFEFWTPGDKVKTQEELERAILKNLKSDKYSQHRNILKDIFFVYKDNKSCERIYKYFFNKNSQKKGSLI